MSPMVHSTNSPTTLHPPLIVFPSTISTRPRPQTLSSDPGSKISYGEVARLLPSLPGDPLPIYLCGALWQQLLAEAASGGVEDEQPAVLLAGLLAFFAKHLAGVDGETRLLRCLVGGERQFVVAADFVPVLHEVLFRHPGLGFLEGAPPCCM